MQKIDKINLCYLLARKYLLFGFNQFYSNVIIVGKENLPSDNSSIIFAPNHLNAFMDALCVLNILPSNKVVVFLAKSDLFNSKLASSILKFAKILPAYRKVDGTENLSKNNYTFEICIETLKKGHAVGIMPEGGQGEKHQIRPLVKGIFRIAYEAQKQLGKEKEIKIIPIGIDMGDLIKSSKNLIINIGKPIVINEYIEDYNLNSSLTINKTKEKLHQSLSELTIDIASEEYYDSIQFISDIEGIKHNVTKNEEKNTLSQFSHKQRVINNILHIQRENPKKMKSIDEDVKILQKKMNDLNLKTAVFKSNNKSILELTLGFPIFFFGFITNFLPMFIPVWIRKLMKVQYDGFYSSVHFSIGLISFPAFYILQAIIVYKFILNNLALGAIFFVLQFVTRKYTVGWWKETIKRIKKASFKKEIKEMDKLFLNITAKI